MPAIELEAGQDVQGLCMGSRAISVLARTRNIGPRVKPPVEGRVPLAVISPHFDDAVLSCSQVLLAHPGSTVITVFGGRPSDGRWSGWDSVCFRRGQDPMKVRQEEDRDALRALGASAVHLPFLDAGYGVTHSTEEITHALALKLDSLAPQSVLFPLGISHRDHVATQKAATNLVTTRPHIRWCIYEELPYRFEYPELGLGQKVELQHLGFALIRLALPCDPSKVAKFRAIRCYRSQLRALGWKRIINSLRYEQYWQISTVGEA